MIHESEIHRPCGDDDGQMGNFIIDQSIILHLIMQRISHLQKVLVVMVITFILAFKVEAWWNSLFIVLYLYYFTFVANLFFKLYDKENTLTKFFFGITELPMIFAGVMIATFIILIRKWYHLENLDSAYLNAFAGALATTIARYKRGKIVRQS